MVKRRASTSGQTDLSWSTAPSDSFLANFAALTVAPRQIYGQSGANWWPSLGLFGNRSSGPPRPTVLQLNRWERKQQKKRNASAPPAPAAPQQEARRKGGKKRYTTGAPQRGAPSAPRPDTAIRFADQTGGIRPGPSGRGRGRGGSGSTRPGPPGPPSPLVPQAGRGRGAFMTPGPPPPGNGSQAGRGGNRGGSAPPSTVPFAPHPPHPPQVTGQELEVYRGGRPKGNTGAKRRSGPALGSPAGSSQGPTPGTPPGRGRPSS